MWAAQYYKFENRAAGSIPADWHDGLGLPYAMVSSSHLVSGIACQ